MTDLLGQGNQDMAPNGTRHQGSSYLYNVGTTPNTRTAVSQKVRILTPGYGQDVRLQMGVLSSFNPSESRTIEPVRGIGFGDIVQELVPSVTEPMSIAFERALLYLSNLWQATGYAAGVDGPVRSLRHHRWPFDVEQQVVFSSLVDGDIDGNVANVGTEGDGFAAAGIQPYEYSEVTNDNNSQPDDNRGHTALVTIYEACWFQDWSTTFAKDAGMIMETGTAMVTDVHDMGSLYGEFLATGNDPTIGQYGSIRHQSAPSGGGQGGFTI